MAPCFIVNFICSSHPLDDFAVYRDDLIRFCFLLHFATPGFLMFISMKRFHYIHINRRAWLKAQSCRWRQHRDDVLRLSAFVFLCSIVERSINSINICLATAMSSLFLFPNCIPTSIRVGEGGNVFVLFTCECAQLNPAMSLPVRAEMLLQL